VAKSDPAVLHRPRHQAKETGTVTYNKQVSASFRRTARSATARTGRPHAAVDLRRRLNGGFDPEVVQGEAHAAVYADPEQASSPTTAACRRTTATRCWPGSPRAVRGRRKELPPEREFSKGWIIGKPDVVFYDANAAKIRQGGHEGIKYQISMVETDYDEDRWIQAAEAKPGAPRWCTTSSFTMAEKARGGARSDGIDGFLVATRPATCRGVTPGTAKSCPRGVLIFQMHYTPDGVERTDCSSVRPGLCEGAAQAGGQDAPLAAGPGHPARRGQLPRPSRSEIRRGRGRYSLLRTCTCAARISSTRRSTRTARRRRLLSVPRWDFQLARATTAW